MGTITSSIGLVSGINTGSIIDQLMTLESRPKTLLQSRIDTINQQKLAYTDLITRLTSLKLTGTTLKKPSSFQNATATSSNESILTATASSGAAVGTYQFQVARLVTAQQTISQGYADPTSTKLLAGNITLEMGGGEISSEPPLSQLNGGTGVRRGMFRITDRSGNTTVIDISDAVTLQDVASKISSSLGINVKAAIGSQGLILTDLTNKSTSNFIVQDIGSGNAAADLGIATVAGGVNSSSITGTDINYLGRNTALAQINDGRGIRTASSGADLRFTFGDSSTIDVNLATAKSMGDVIDAINTAGAGKVQASLVAGADGIRLTDISGLGGTFSVANIGDSHAATDLGIATSETGTINGGPVIAQLGSVLISSLRGGTGLDVGTFQITDRNGTVGTVDLTGKSSVQDILDAINSSGASVKAALNASGNGIQITDTSGGTGNLVIADSTGTSAAELGIAGTFDISTSVVRGTNLQRQWVSQNTLLSDYNGGKGVSPGTFTITNSSGTSFTIDMTGSNYTRLSDVIQAINVRGMGVTASINANGDGLLLTDTAGGAGKLKVVDTTGTTATDLNIAGTATGTTIDGSFEKTIAVTANDTLTTLQQKINTLGFGVSANIINDGSGVTPYHLSLTARNSGRDGRVVFDAGSTGLQTTNLIEAQDAAMFIGGGGSAQPLLVTSSTNQISNVIKGVTLNLNGVSSNPVTLSITQDSSNIVTQLTGFTSAFNDMVDKIDTLTSFDSTTNKSGLLLGESSVSDIQNIVYGVLTSVVSGAGRYHTLADLGLKMIDGAKLSFDEEKFKSAYATDPQAVQNFFTQANTGIGNALETAINKLTDPTYGELTVENKTLDQQAQGFQDRITQLDALLASKRTRLEQQFANMESVLATLQSQQSALASLSNLSNIYSSSSSSKSSSSSSSK